MSRAKKLSRRDLLRLSLAAGAGTILASCRPAAPAPVETPAAPTAASATEAPAATAEATAAPTELPSKFMFSTWGDYRFYEDAFKRMQQDYPQYASVKFENSQSDSSTGLNQRLMTDFAAKSWDTLLDVCEMGTGDVPQMAQSGILLDLTDYLKPFEKDISPAVLEMLQVDGKYYAVPWMPNTSMVWYRKDVFDMAGVDADKIETWEDFIAAGKAVTDFQYPDGVKRYMVDVPATSPSGMALQLMLGQQGAGLFDPTSGECTIDKDPAFKKAFDVCVRLATEGICIRMDEWAAPWYTALEEGTIAAYIAANWMDQIIQLNMPKAKGQFRAMKLPAFEKGGCRGTFETGSANVVIINKPNANVELCWTYIQHSFLNSKVTGSLTADWRLVPAFLPALDHPYYSTPNEFYGGQILGKLDREIQAEAKPFHFTKNHNEAMNLILTEMARVYDQKKPEDQAIADAAAAIRKDIGTSF